MGTRADFYVGRGTDAEWIGSIAFDGYPNAKGKSGVTLEDVTTEREFREYVGGQAKQRDFTSPEMGWPWPWDDSGTTDYAYAFDDGHVWISQFGSGWLTWQAFTTAEDPPPAIFPNMADRKRVAFGERSGLIVVTGSK